MNREWSGGKGDARRKQANDQKYRAGWDRIFGQTHSELPERPNGTDWKSVGPVQGHEGSNPSPTAT